MLGREFAEWMSGITRGGGAGLFITSLFCGIWGRKLEDFVSGLGRDLSRFRDL